MLFRSSPTVPIKDLFAASNLPQEEFTETLQNLFDQNQAVFYPAASEEQQDIDAEEFGVFGHEGAPAGFVAILPQPRGIKASLNAEQENVVKATMEDVNKLMSAMRGSMDEAIFQGQETFPRRVNDPNLHPALTKEVRDKMEKIAIAEIKKMRENGIPVQELPSVIASPNFKVSDPFLGLAMKEWIMAEALRAMEQEVLTLSEADKFDEAEELQRRIDKIQEVQQMAGSAWADQGLARATINRSDRYGFMFTLNKLAANIRAEIKKRLNISAPGAKDVAEDLKKASDEGTQEVADELDDIAAKSDEALAMEAMNETGKNLWTKAKGLISSIAEKVRELMRRGDKNFKASSLAAGGDKFKGMTNDELRASIKKDREELEKTLLEFFAEMSGGEAQPTKGKRKPKATPAQIRAARITLFRSMATIGRAHV